MNKEIAQELLIWVNNPEWEQSVKRYVEYRTLEIYKSLAQSKTLEDMKFYQGKLDEVNYLTTLRDRINSYSKD